MIETLNWVNRVSSKKNPENILRSFCVVLVVFLAFALGAKSYASDITTQKIIELANLDRKEEGLNNLAENEKLANAAMAKAEDMLKDNYFSHTAPDGTTPWKWIEGEEYDYNYAGENLAMDFVSADKMNRAWLNSPTHRANILNDKYKDIGVAVKEGIISGHDSIVVVQMFGSGDKKPAAVKEEKNGLTKNAALQEPGIPKLPIGAEQEISAKQKFFPAPMITSPQAGEKLSGGAVAVYGRAKSGTVVRIYDRDEFLASAIASTDGWFRTDLPGLGDGKHSLRAEGERSGQNIKGMALDARTDFSIDSKKPEMKYQLYAGKSPDERLISISSGKPNCNFEIGGERIFSHSGTLLHAIKTEAKLSLVLKVSDSVGNKDIDEINLAAYHAPDSTGDLIQGFAAAIGSDKIFSADSARVAVTRNLGIPKDVYLSKAN